MEADAGLSGRRNPGAPHLAFEMREQSATIATAFQLSHREKVKRMGNGKIMHDRFSRIQRMRVFQRMRMCRLSVAVAAALFILSAAAANASSRRWPPPPVAKNVTISNGGLSVTFNVDWGAVVIGIANKNVAHGLNIVDFNDVGRELQTDQFLSRKIDGKWELIVNPTQAGAEGYQAYYQHPKGIVFPQKGSPVVHWTSTHDHFHATIRPWDYDTGQPTNWVYVEDVHIDRKGVAHFHYTFHNHESKTYRMSSEVPTLYSDRTDAFMFPLTSPYDHSKTQAKQPAKLVHAEPHWPQKKLTSKGWIANIDTVDNLGIFYTTPVGLSEALGSFPKASVSDKLPLGKTNVAIENVTSYPGEIYSIDFSVLVATPKEGPALISKQPPAVSKILHNVPPKSAAKQ